MASDRSTTAPTIPEPASDGRHGAAHSRIVDSDELFGARREIQIRHNGACYTLRQTRQGKLILTK
jgi:hemin uptake protein HemP